MLVTSFVGRNKDFRTWLAAGMPTNVVSLWRSIGQKEKTAQGERPELNLLNRL